jgi:hypothetical protein
MSYITNYQYYNNSGNHPEDANWGEYQYVTMKDLINNFMLMYVGNDKLVNNVDIYNIRFHAKRAIQEINYDALRNIKAIEKDLGEDLKMILPHDFINYIRISLLKNGVLIPLVESRTAITAKAYLQDNDLNIIFDSNGEIVTGTSKLDILRQNKQLYTGSGPYNGYYGWPFEGEWYFGYGIGRRFGMETDNANRNPKFTINSAAGVIDFTSGVENGRIVLEYISDGMENGDDSKISINKLAEEYIYSYLKWAVLNNKTGVQEYIIRRAKDEKSANLRNAKIRLSNLHPSRLLMSMRGKDKWIK